MSLFPASGCAGLRAAVAVTFATLCAQGTVHSDQMGAARAPTTAASPQGVGELVPGVVIERELSGQQSHRYQLTLASGDFVHITIEQQGIDVAVRFVRPDGRDLLAIDASDDDFRPETIAAIADVTGRFTIDIRPAPSAGPRGRYAVRVDELRPAAALDGVRVEAERAYAGGRALFATRVARDWPGALDALGSALNLYRQVGDRRGELKALIDLGDVQGYLVRPESLQSAQQAEQIAREVGDPAARASALGSIGLAHDRAGDRTPALQAYEESTAISRRIGNRAAEASSLSGEGWIYAATGDGEKAIARFEQALPLARATNHRKIEMSAIRGAGAVNMRIGAFREALGLFEQALTLARAQNHRWEEIAVINYIGMTQVCLGNNRSALQLHTRALALSRAAGDKEQEAYSLNLIGFAHNSLGHYIKALEYHRSALAIRRALHDARTIAFSLADVGTNLHRLNQNQAAREALREALTLVRNIREQYIVPGVWYELAAVERDEGNLADAHRYIEAAVDIEETLRARMARPDLRATFVADRQYNFDLFIDVLQRRHAVNPAGGYAAAALQVSERARARVLLESVLGAGIDLYHGVDPELLDRVRSLQPQLNDASEQLARTLAADRHDRQATAAAQTLERLTAEYQRLQAQVRQQNPRYAPMTHPQPLGAAAIQQSVIDDDTVLLEFALGDERSWLWAVTTNTITSVELPPRREVEAAAQSLYKLFIARQRRAGESGLVYAKRVAAADARLAVQAHSVSRMLLRGIAAPLNGEWRDKRLAIVAAGALEYLPFGALPLPDADRTTAHGRSISGRQRSSRTPLAARHEIVTIPSASVLAVLRREAAGREQAPRSLAILADAVFELADPRVTSKKPRPSSPVKDEAAAGGLALVDAGWARKGFSRLPFSRDEANAIAALADASLVFKAVDFKASRETVLSGALRGHRIVHFATHGVLDSERPSLSGLILSLFDESGARQNGYLRLHDIYDLRLAADLVVLSACQTALGEQIAGEGLIGLTRAFMYAGTSRVVASLWEVSDLATAELMKKFYRGVLTERLPPAAALRAAQLELAQDPRWTSPYYWAGFIFQGDWK